MKIINSLLKSRDILFRKVIFSREWIKVEEILSIQIMDILKCLRVLKENNLITKKLLGNQKNIMHKI